MTAVCGIYYFDDKLVNEIELDGMLKALAHRGPDGSGKWIAGPVGLGCQIMWTTPESLHEKLPFAEKQNKLAITANARIDNRGELAAKLSLSLSGLAGMPDSLLILRAYEKWGHRCVDHLLGDFVFAIWDGNARELSCYSDHMELRVIYYYRNEKFIAFASEIKALLAIPGVPKAFNERRLANSLVYALVPHEIEQTFYRDIYLLKAGSILRAGRNKFSIEEYWRPGATDIHLSSEAEYYEAFRELFCEAVRCRTRSAYPVASELSGGLDSSSITCVAARELRKQGKELLPFSVVLPENHAGPEKDEREFIRLVQSQENLNVRYISLAEQDPFAHLEAFIYMSETPDHGHSESLSYELYRSIAATGARTVLNGTCGETGASSYAYGFLAELFLKGDWASMVKEIVLGARMEKRKVRAVVMNDLVYFLLPETIKIMYDRHLRGMTKTPLERSVINRDFARRERVEERLGRYGVAHGALGSTQPDVQINETVNLDILRRPKGLCPLVHNLERSYPFLDKRLVEFCLAVPSALKVKNGWRRNLLRASMEGILPSEIQWRTTKTAYIPDMHARLDDMVENLSREFAQLGENDRVWEYLDRDGIKTRLAAVEKARIPTASSMDRLNEIVILQVATRVNRFLNWFDG